MSLLVLSCDLPVLEIFQSQAELNDDWLQLFLHFAVIFDLHVEVLAEIFCIVIQVIELFLVCLETLFQPIIVRFQIAYLALELFLFTMMFFLKNFFSISHLILSQLVSNQIETFLMVLTWRWLARVFDLFRQNQSSLIYQMLGAFDRAFSSEGRIRISRFKAWFRIICTVEVHIWPALFWTRKARVVGTTHAEGSTAIGQPISVRTL